MKLWVAKPFYQVMPYYNVVVGGIAVAAGFYLTHWYWQLLSTIAGIVSIAVGVVVLSKRRNDRSSAGLTGERV